MAAKERSIKRIFKVIGIILLVIALFPIPYFYKDGGSIELVPITGIYSVWFNHEHYIAETIDGVIYRHESHECPYYIGGTIIKVFGQKVYDDLRIVPEDPPRYTDEVTDLISYCKSVCPENLHFRWITFKETEEDSYAILDFERTDSLQTSDEVLKLVREYTKTHPDYFISKCNDLYVLFYNMGKRDMIHYKVSMPNFTDIKMELVSEVIPDERPENYDFIEVSKIRAENVGSIETAIKPISGGKERNLLSESEAAILSELYPTAQIGDFDEDLAPDHFH